jgi:mannose-6-phosphate isomerase-like protein (cupin superfamily)
MDFEDRTMEIHPGELLVVPKGTLHKPRAPKAVKVLLFEPKTTLNTGDTTNAFTVEHPDRI